MVNTTNGPTKSQDRWTTVDGCITGLLAGLPPIAVTPNQDKLLDCSREYRAHARSWNWGRRAATARSGWLKRCPRTGAWLRQGRVQGDRPGEWRLSRHALDRRRASQRGRVTVRSDRRRHRQEEHHRVLRVSVTAVPGRHPDRRRQPLRNGAILGPDTYDPVLSDENIKGVRRFFELLAAERRVSATAIQPVGSKGYDGSHSRSSEAKRTRRNPSQQ
jgi:hypothetical protein